jgi:hypothetical protein
VEVSEWLCERPRNVQADHNDVVLEQFQRSLGFATMSSLLKSSMLDFGARTALAHIAQLAYPPCLRAISSNCSGSIMFAFELPQQNRFGKRPSD